MPLSCSKLATSRAGIKYVVVMVLMVLLLPVLPQLTAAAPAAAPQFLDPHFPNYGYGQQYGWPGVSYGYGQQYGWPGVSYGYGQLYGQQYGWPEVSYGYVGDHYSSIPLNHGDHLHSLPVHCDVFNSNCHIDG